MGDDEMRVDKSAAEREKARGGARTNITSTIDISMRYLLG